MRYRFILAMVVTLSLVSVQDAKAQSNVVIDPLDEAFFRSMFAAQDSAGRRNLFADKLGKRFAFHLNVVDWALTMPGGGIEFDLNKTKKNNRSILLFGKYNGNTKHTINPKYVFNVGAIRLEFRKYWRTGRLGMNDTYHEEYRTMHLYKPDTLWRKVNRVNEFGEEVVEKEFYFSPKDSAWIAEGNSYEGDPNRGRFSNVYENIRRVTSTRTMKQSRNWRAYYLGAFAGWDKYSWCYGKKGEQGTILSVGATFGYTIPMLTRRYPKEGGLDLDFGINVGVPVVKYDSYRCASQGNNHIYAPTGHTLADGWSISPKYALRDVHVSLVYRMRSVSRKVSLALVDDYYKHIQKWEDRMKRISDEKRMIEELAQQRLDSVMKSEAFSSDAMSWNDWQRKDYLKAFVELYPDVELHGQDSLDYIRLVLGKDLEGYKREKARIDRLNKQLEDLKQDSIDRANRMVERDSMEKAKIEERKQKRHEKDSLEQRNAFVKDSIAHVRDSLEKIRKDSVSAVRDSIQAVKDAERKEKQAILDRERKEKQDAKDAMRREAEAKKEAERQAKEAEQAAKRAEEEAKRKAEEEAKSKERIEREVQRKLDDHQRDVDKKAKKAQEEARKKMIEADRAAEREARKIEEEAEKRAREAEKQMKEEEAEKRKQMKEAEAAEKAAEKERKAAEAEAKKQADKEAKEAEKARKEAEKAEAEAKKQAEKEAKQAEKEAKGE